MSDATPQRCPLAGVDFGTKRIGLALSDAGRMIAAPLTTVTYAGGHDAAAQAVLTATADHRVTAYVVGLPLDLDGGEGLQARRVRNFGRKLAQLSGLPVHFWDEGLTTAASDAIMSQAGMGRARRKGLRDQLAAQIMLQSYLDAQTPT